MNHLNEDKLIQYTFDLLEANEQQATQQHLDECAECRNALKQLQTKFAAMESLADEVPPSEELIAQTIAHSKQKPEAEAPGLHHPVKNVWHRVIASCSRLDRDSTLLSQRDTQTTIPLYRRRWVEWSAAAAAVALVCFLFLQNLPDTKVKEPKQVAKSSAPEWPKHPASESANKPLAEQDLGTQQKPAMPFPDDRMAALSSTDQDSVATTALPLPRGSTPKGGGGYSDTTSRVRVVNADEIPDKPPFAPASAIELVVLPKPDKTQVTIYNSKDLTLVRDTRKLTLKSGWNWLQFMWDGTLIDPTSLSLRPLEHADKIDIQQLVYPARLKDIGRWLIRSEVEGAVPFEITYFASGLSWRAFYMGTMNENETTMDLKGYVNVSNNSGQDFANTQTRLIVGETRLTEEIRYLAQRKYPYGPEPPDVTKSNIVDGILRRKGAEKVPILGDMPIDGALFREISGDIEVHLDTLGVKEIEKTGLSEYFLYTIEGTEDLTNQWTKRLPSFDIENIPVKSLYKYDDDRYGKQTVRFVSFKNDTEHELGETPIPEGSIKIYRNINDQHNLSYIGQSNIKYIPVNEGIELNLGPARLVKVEPVLMETKTENHTFDKNGNIDGWDGIGTYKVTVTNTRDIPVDIEITWNMGMDTWELDMVDPTKTVEYKKHDKSRARFTLTVGPQSKSQFDIEIRYYLNKRIEAYTQKMQEQEK